MANRRGDDIGIPSFGRRERDHEYWGLDPETGERTSHDITHHIMKNRLDIEVVKEHIYSMKQNDLKNLSDDIVDINEKVDKMDSKLDSLFDKMNYSHTFIKYGGMIIGTLIMTVLVPILLKMMGLA